MQEKVQIVFFFFFFEKATYECQFVRNVLKYFAYSYNTRTQMFAKREVV